MDAQSNIIDLAKTGKYSYQEMGNACNVSRQYVHQVLKKNGIDVAWSKQRLKDAYDQQIYGEAVNIVKDKYRHGMTVKQAAEDVGVPLAIVEKLWTKTQEDEDANRKARLYALTKEDENGCLIWQGNFGANGQPRFNAGGQSLAMYHTYWHEFGKFPKKGMKRSCKNGKCVNPRHLK